MYQDGCFGKRTAGICLVAGKHPLSGMREDIAVGAGRQCLEVVRAARVQGHREHRRASRLKRAGRLDHGDNQQLDGEGVGSWGMARQWRAG